MFKKIVLTLTSVWIFKREVPVSVLAAVTPGAVDVGLAVALASDHLFLVICRQLYRVLIVLW